MALEQQFEHVLQFIDEHLSENLSIEILADKAGVPVNHFEFIFFSLYHTQFKDYLSLIRNIEAAQTLGFDKSVPIEQVAKAAGYASTTAFTDGFTLSIGQSPEAFRQAPDWGNFFAKQQPLKTFSEGHEQLDHLDASICIETLTELELVMIEHRGPALYVSQSIQALIAFTKAHCLPPSQHRTFNFIYSQPQNNNHDYSIDIGVNVSQAQLSKLKELLFGSAHFKAKTLPKGRYAVLSHNGSQAELASKIKYLYGTWLAKMKYQLGEQPLTFERFDMGNDDENVNLKIYLAIT
ncbi:MULTISPECIES: AraC family transcriptional regulator [Pseudomonadati]|uniref:AraC family transcriptional regulator n=1 Tax=Shewanella aestuarii TaxID=1028752 RepID=A0ABT0L339_9GAMM|nr:AraC family transcriptional regulator [Shewanella aestuarii]MCL1118127.1 AraC family transcriptional regulator [Shewanella aestuarii]GGN81687.1 AraC family transcriptional regulator [Shewanella aestuarii]